MWLKVFFYFNAKDRITLRSDPNPIADFFFDYKLLTNEWASDGNILGAYTRESKEDLQSIFM